MICIKWFDSAIFPATAVYSTGDLAEEEPIILETVGWLILETDSPYGGSYILAASRHGEDWRGVQIISKANVLKVAAVGELLEPVNYIDVGSSEQL